MMVRGFTSLCSIVLASVGTLGAAEEGHLLAVETFESDPWRQLVGEIRRDLRAAVDPIDGFLPSTEDEVHERLAGLLNGRLLDPWHNPLMIEVDLVAQTAERLVYSEAGGAPTLEEVEQQDLVVAVVSGGPDWAIGTSDDFRVAYLRVPLPRRGEADPALLREPRHGAIVGVVFDRTSGRPLPGVMLIAAGASVLGERAVASDAHGRFALGGLPPGDYDVRFQLEGYGDVSREVAVRARSARRVEVELDFPLLDGCG